MSSIGITTTSVPEHHQAPITNWDDRRGTHGMLLFIVTEAALFVVLFFSYFYLASFNSRWPLDEPPKLTLALIMLVVLLCSSVILHAGEKRIRSGRYASGRFMLAGTIVAGIGFVILQSFEYRDHLKTLTPRSDAYGSIFYTITSFHAAHLIIGLLMLSYVLILPGLEPVDRPPHRAYHNAALYWHFVDFIWILIVGILYILPNVQR